MKITKEEISKLRKYLKFIKTSSKKYDIIVDNLIRTVGTKEHKEWVKKENEHNTLQEKLLYSVDRVLAVYGTTVALKKAGVKKAREFALYTKKKRGRMDCFSEFGDRHQKDKIMYDDNGELIQSDVVLDSVSELNLDDYRLNRVNRH